MNAQFPIFTAATECQDCYKCIRHCPVKAIKVEDGYASIVSGLCVLCGDCERICPNGAKKVRDDRRFVERLMASGRRLVVSLAPSFASEFPNVSPAAMAAALRRIGFAGVSETALGAQQVSARLGELLREAGPRVWLSTACPVVVEYVRKYRPEFAPLLTPVLSPMLAHARLLRREFGEDTGVIFIGPCIAKKHEADTHPDWMDGALTFEDLRNWFESAGIAPETLQPSPEDRFLPDAAREGALYPIEGGMIAGIHAPGAHMMTFSGLSTVIEALNGLDRFHPRSPILLELLACPGGCVNGPASSQNGGAAARRWRILEYSASAGPQAAPVIPLHQEYPAEPVDIPSFHESQIREALRGVGKQLPEDELNCGGCGYDSCRAFAAAFLMGRAERRMCVTYMRKLAEKKTHALLRKLPSAIVIVDDALRIVECNPNFARFFGSPDAPEGGETLEGALLDTVVPFYNLFETVLRTGEEVPGKDIRYHGKVFHVTVFTIEKHTLAGGIFRDISTPAARQEQMIERTRQVIQKNLQTVQQIAYLLGENAADSEIALNSIIESLTPDRVEDDDEPR